MKAFLTLVTLLLAMHPCISQTVEPSSGIGKSELQLETELSFYEEQEAVSKNKFWSVPNMLLRYGLSDNIELQLYTPFTSTYRYENNDLVSRSFKFDEIQLGTSINLWKQNRWIPEAAVMARFCMPTKDFALNTMCEVLSLNLSNVINTNWSLNYNIGSVIENGHKSYGFCIANLDYQPNPKRHYFIETTGTFDELPLQSYTVGGGMGFFIKNNMSIDFSMAKSLKQKAVVFGLIVSWNTNV